MLNKIGAAAVLGLTFYAGKKYGEFVATNSFEKLAESAKAKVHEYVTPEPPSSSDNK